MWCIPGAPLVQHRGWKLWYCNAGAEAFSPQQPAVYRCTDPQLGSPQKISSQPVAVKFSGQLLDPIKELNRRVFIAELQILDESEVQAYWVDIPETGNHLILQALPKSIPQEGVSFILTSCFWRNDDKEGRYALGIERVMERLKPRPSFKILAGDQLYLDYPLLFCNASDKVYGRYLDYWGDLYYQSVLRASANYFICDDHEFWNNYPEKQLQLPYTYQKKSRKKFSDAATACFEQFQQQLNPNAKRWYQFDISPVSFFALDTRSKRSEFKCDSPQFMEEEQWIALERWQYELKGPGILIIGQPVYQKDGDWKDYSLSNFKDNYGRLLSTIKRSFDGINADGKRHDIVILTGDIHHGRHAVGMLGPDQELHEFVSSPASRIGPFFSAPKLESLPSKITARYQNQTVKITNIRSVKNKSEEISNHTGVLLLTPHPGGGIELDFRLYPVRDATQPYWKFLSRKRSKNYDACGHFCSYSSTQFNKLILQ